MKYCLPLVTTCINYVRINSFILRVKKKIFQNASFSKQINASPFLYKILIFKPVCQFLAEHHPMTNSLQ